jgi:hypothetical protein
MIPTRLNPYSIVNISANLLERWSRPVPAENLEFLLYHLQQPLTEEEKVPISKEGFDYLSLSSYSEVYTAWTPEDIKSVFRVSDDEMAKQFFHPLC